MRSTHTYVVLEVGDSAFEEIWSKLDAAGYGDQFSMDDKGRLVIDMHGIALRKVLTLGFMERFLSDDFIGGTLVEYKDRHGFNVEWKRGVITKVSGVGGIRIETDTDAGLFYSQHAQKVQPVNPIDGVFHIELPYPCNGINYAVAPKGINIPTPSERKNPMPLGMG